MGTWGHIMVLSGRLALVTGGGRGIGRAVCQVLARDNAKVVATDLSMDSCQETMQSLRPDDHFTVASDVSKSGSVNECFKQILEKYKRAPDIIVNSAGITKDGFMLRMKEEDFDKVIDVNLKGTFLVTQAAAKELGRFGIRVNVILPGFIKTPMTDVVPDKMKMMVQFQIPLSNSKNGRKGEVTEEDSWKRRLAEKLIGRPLGDFGDPEDIAETAAFLASHRSKYMTGASIDVNGGLL